MQLFKWEAKMFKKKNTIAHETMKKGPQKLLIIGPNFFSLLPTGAKSAQIS
jgi:hypothetical protein